VALSEVEGPGEGSTNMLIRIPHAWQIPEGDGTPEHLYLTRRAFLVAAAASVACTSGGGVAATIPKPAPPYPFARNPKYALDRPITDEIIAATYNNFYEFTPQKNRVWTRVSRFRVEPWTIEVTGLVSNPLKISVDELLRTMPMEERLYRHRCVEAWSMAVPWTGFPLSRLLLKADPKHEARFVRFVSFSDPVQQPGVGEQRWYPWPYYEGLRLDEAMNELTLVVTGVYGHSLPRQHGAPIRIVTPWKYGYKSAKSIVRIELVDKQPATFWEDVASDEYPFQSNVNPAVPHPRWSQATERVIGTWDVRKTLPFNGYGSLVAHLYK
jgi:sulfoxide reductase catalytic subunit YedY